MVYRIIRAETNLIEVCDAITVYSIEYAAATPSIYPRRTAAGRADTLVALFQVGSMDLHHFFCSAAPIGGPLMLGAAALAIGGFLSV